jgi:deoxyribonuclease I
MDRSWTWPGLTPALVLLVACAPLPPGPPGAPAETSPSAGSEAPEATPAARQPVAKASDEDAAAPQPAQPPDAAAPWRRFRDLPSGWLPPAARPTRERAFGSSTDRALGRLHADRRVTFYCGCAFDERKRVDHASCGYAPGPRWQNRAGRIEWEHVVPASRMMDGRPCVSDPARGRRAPRTWCRRTDPEFRAMEGDLQNLVPVIGQLNAERSDLPYGELRGKGRRFGRCDFLVGEGAVEPGNSIRGDIARIHAYMAATYGLALTAAEEAMFVRWSQQDPPTADERAYWNRKGDVLGVVRRWKAPADSAGAVARESEASPSTEPAWSTD